MPPTSQSWSNAGENVLEKKRKAANAKGPLDAEAMARRFIKDRNPSVRQILFKRTSKEGGFWLLEGEALLKRLRFFKVRKLFRLKISVEDGELISYEEKRHR